MSVPAAPAFLPAGHGAWGERLGRCFELADAPALVMLDALAAPFAATRIVCAPGQLGMKPGIPPEDAFAVTLHLSGMRHHELWLRGRPAVVRGYAVGALAIADLRDEVAHYVGSPFDALSFYVPRALIDAVADAEGQPRVDALACRPGLIDPVMRHLGAAVLALMTGPQHARPAMSDHLGIAICAHLVRRYGVGRGRACGPALLH